MTLNAHHLEAEIRALICQQRAIGRRVQVQRLHTKLGEPAQICCTISGHTGRRAARVQAVYLRDELACGYTSWVAKELELLERLASTFDRIEASQDS
jgi:hypothetical protein